MNVGGSWVSLTLLKIMVASYCGVASVLRCFVWLFTNSWSLAILVNIWGGQKGEQRGAHLSIFTFISLWSNCKLKREFISVTVTSSFLFANLVKMSYLIILKINRPAQTFVGVRGGTIIIIITISQEPVHPSTWN